MQRKPRARSKWVRWALKGLGSCYRLVTDYGPVPRYPWLYWPMRRYVNFYVSRLWRADPWVGLPDSRTELLIASAGHCASNSLATYLKTHNPGRNILLGAHAPAPVVFAVRNQIPCLILTRDILAWMKSSYESEEATGAHNPVLFYKTVVPLLDHVVTASFDEVVTSPSVVVRRVNARFATDFNEGDDQFPWVKVYRSDPETGAEVKQ